MLDEVLVALQLGRGIAAHRLVVVGRYGRVENVHREVQDAVLRVLVGLDNLVHWPLGEGFSEILGRGEMVCVEVALVGDEEVGGAEDANHDGSHPFAPESGELLRVLRLSLRQIGPKEQ